MAKVDEICELAARIPDIVAQDAELQIRGREVNARFLLEVENRPFFFQVVNGRISNLTATVGTMPLWSFAVRAGADAWAQFWSPEPPPFFHDVFAMKKTGAMRIEGDWRPLMTDLLYFKGVLASPRSVKAS